ncbi:MAG: pectate lyase, partial [Gemmatales bacterium]|nr:pectate lyase [Gemmatales bacterium]
MHRLTPASGVVLIFSAWVWPDDAAELRQSAQTALARATRYLHEKVSVRGTYLWRYSGDLIQRFGERRATPTQGWIQPPGTPSVALALLRAYEATQDRIHLEAALASAHALVDTQLASGGWDYLVDFHPREHGRWFYRKDVEAGERDPGPRRNSSTYDDDTTQSALRFLMEIDRTLKHKEERIH